MSLQNKLMLTLLWGVGGLAEHAQKEERAHAPIVECEDEGPICAERYDRFVVHHAKREENGGGSGARATLVHLHARLVNAAAETHILAACQLREISILPEKVAHTHRL